MANLAKLEFVALDITEKNYLSWILDDEIHLEANALGEQLKMVIMHPIRIKQKQ